MDFKILKNSAAILVLAVVLISVYTWFTTPLIVTVSGKGEVDVPASNATVTFSVIGEGANATDAIANIKGKLANLKKAIKGSGIDETSMIQSQVMVVPASSIVAGVSGYRSTISVGITKIPTARIDSFIPVLYSGGASLVSTPAIDVGDQSELEKAAFRKALNDAQKQAGDIGRQNGKLFKKAIAITQSSTPSTTVSGQSDTFAGVGTSKITSVVSVSYKMW
jgi:uncharacterized protein YggE